MADDFSINESANARLAIPSTNGASGESPGQRPGNAVLLPKALKGRDTRYFAPSGLEIFLTIIPRPSTWANRIGPSGRNTHPVLVSVFDPVRVVPPAQATGLWTMIPLSVFDPVRVVLPAQATGLGTGATTGFLGRNTHPVSVSVFDPVRVVPPAQATGLGTGVTPGTQPWNNLMRQCQFALPRKREKAIKANLRGPGYGG